MEALPKKAKYHFAFGAFFAASACPACREGHWREPAASVAVSEGFQRRPTFEQFKAVFSADLP